MPKSIGQASPLQIVTEGQQVWSRSFNVSLHCSLSLLVQRWTNLSKICDNSKEKQLHVCSKVNSKFVGCFSCLISGLPNIQFAVFDNLRLNDQHSFRFQSYRQFKIYIFLFFSHGHFLFCVWPMTNDWSPLSPDILLFLPCIPLTYQSTPTSKHNQHTSNAQQCKSSILLNTTFIPPKFTEVCHSISQHGKGPTM